jgi:glucose/arabinose dehydrogenase/mono/diheme cytochrome c family protein
VHLAFEDARMSSYRSFAAQLRYLPAIAAIALASGATLQTASAATSSCRGDNGGLTLSPGFCATIFADNLGHVRHMVVAADGTLYANTWSGRYFPHSPPPPGGFLLALKDTKGDGHADDIKRFGVTVEEGGTGGSGIALYNGALYAEENSRILRYALTPGQMVPTAKPTVVVSGLTLVGDHPMHPFIIDSKGDLFVDVGSATNACQSENRIAGVPGIEPCTEKETRAGIWRYDANKSDQPFSPAERYVSGLRNGEGMAFDSAGRMFATQHGRDQLFQNWPKLYTADQSAELPAEELVEIKRGADYGWPECYYDQIQGKLVLAPEYGGDGKKVGLCAHRTPPVAAFPGHWAPNDLMIYHGTKFPEGYRGGAFIAFHGSWNRAPDPQQGYDVVFQPLADGKASGKFVVFADGFSGGFNDPGKAAFRPTGLAEAPDGSVYVADDKHGRIWRIAYEGNGNDKVASAAPASVTKIAIDNSQPPEGTHPHAGALPVPPGATMAEVELGDRIFHGQAAQGTCSGCHGSDAGGSPQGPPLNSGHWAWSDGTLAGIRETIAKGVPHPKQYQGVMPPLGGAPLSKADLDAVAAYVWAVGHGRNQ